MDDAGWIDRFIRHLEYERRLSALTCKNYRRDLERFVEYLETVGVPVLGWRHDWFPAFYSRSSGLQKLMATPSRPARAVRPMRCT